MISWLSILFTALLSVALIAFGWQPCCCVLGCCSDSSVRTLTFHQTGGTPLDGFTLTFAPIGTDFWSANPASLPCDLFAAAFAYTFNLQCVGAAYRLTISAPGGNCLFTFDAPITTVACSPFHLQGTGSLTGGLCTAACKTTFSYDVI